MSAQSSFQAIIMAAGKGTRMKSRRAKVLHEVVGEPMLGHVISAALGAGAQRVIVVLGHDLEQVQAFLHAHPDADKLHAVVQYEQLGTGHAVYTAREYLGQDAPPLTYILSGDVPNLSTKTLVDFAAACHSEEAAKLAILSAVVDEPGAYGRLLRDAQGKVTGIVEARDASAEQLAVREVNTGTYIASTPWLHTALESLINSPVTNAAGEHYLTDLVAAAVPDAMAWSVPNFQETLGVNTREQLAQAGAFAQARLNASWMAQGVTMIDPTRTYIERHVVLEPDVTLFPDVYLRGRTHVCAGTVIEPGAFILDSFIGADVTIKASCYLQGAQVGQDTSVGPFAHLRPGADLGQGCKVGNFVEVKKSRLDDGAKASHLTYLGDAHVGANANIGAGTITCNYDGVNKHKTIIGEGAFIGSNTALVAPVTVGKEAFVGAGSTITTHVPDGALGVARSRQRNIEDWAAKSAPRKKSAQDK